VNNPAATLSVTSPDSLDVGGPQSTLTVTGSGYVQGSVVKIDDDALQTTFINERQLNAIVPAAKLTSADGFYVHVENPDPGGSSSMRVKVNVVQRAAQSCDTSGTDVQLGSAGAPQSFALDYKLGPAPRFRWQPAEPSSYICPVAELSTSSQPFAAVVVQNTSGATASLSAWAVCDATGDAAMAFYAGTAAAPASDAARLQCSSAVSWGQSGPETRTSPEAGGSSWCPGLTKANGGAVALAPCDKAVVFVQPYWDDPTQRPTSLKVQLEN
jgi:hypothetical protein